MKKSRIPHPSIAERQQKGKAARQILPREALAAWSPPAGRRDPLDLLEAQAATRVPELVPIRYGRMLASPFAFYRGGAAIMAADLASGAHTGLQVQLCGDAHLSNFGGFASPERELILDLNDFDETLPGPWEWDVKRLAASLEIAGRERGFDAKTCRSLVLAAAGEYRHSMNEFAGLRNLEMWYLHLTPAEVQARWGVSVKPKALKALTASLTQGQHRDNLRAMEKLTRRVNGRLRIAANPPLIVPVEDLDSSLLPADWETTLHRLIASYRMSLQPDLRYLLESFEYLHMARKVVGVGSVGTRCWVILLQGRDPDDPLFLQVKEAEASVMEPYLGKSNYAEHGKRVVEGQRMLQAASDIFLGWERIQLGVDGKVHDYYLRQLWDWKISADVETMGPDELLIYGRVCGFTLARAHARSGDRVAISAYLGKSRAVESALADFAAAYADQNQQDYRGLAAAVKDGRVKAQTGI
jgi:uncharacterized protein (DUF2252 family)